VEDKNMQRIRGIIGILAMIIFVVGTLVWNFALRDVVTGVDVVVAKRTIQQGDVIKAEDLDVTKIDSRSVIPNAILNGTEELKGIIGKAALHPIPMGSQLIPDQFDDASVVIGEDEVGTYLYSIPSSWILSVPDTVRRLDNVSFYAVLTESKNTITSAQGSIAGQTTAGEQQPESAATDENVIKVSTLDEIKDFIVKSDGIVDLKITCPVAYVKDGSNKEVRSADENGITRMDGTSKVAKIEVIATVEQVQAIEKLIRNGYKLILMYK
jgi:hypothetical protein